MASFDFVLIRSWHVVLTPTRMFDTYRTLCGRTATGQTVTILPAGKSCETCARIALRAADRPEDDGSTWTEA